MGLETTVKPETIDKEKNSLVYSISHGSGGFKATYEAVKVFYEPSNNKPFKVKFVNPSRAYMLERFTTLNDAIKFAQREARERLKRTVTVNYKQTKKPHNNYPEGIPKELSRFV